MECREWQGVISSVHDGEAVTPEQLAEATAHCASCAECAAFAESLARLDTMRAPLAPPDLTERIMSAVDAAAAIDAREPEPLVNEAAETSPEWLPAWVTRRRLWGATAIAAAAAVIAAFAFFSSRVPGTPESTRFSGAPIVAAPELAGQPDEEDAGVVPTSGAAAGDTKSAAEAPSYIAFSGHVYRPGTPVNTEGSALTTIGATTTSLDSPATPSLLNVFRSPTADGSILVATPSGMQQFQPVVRSLSGKNFHLATGTELTRYGQWPTLPARFTHPALPDGTPTFHEAGTDAIGAKIYTVAGATADSGFAIAPGTSAGDPAGGNPDWTWWDPLVVP